MVQVVDNKKYAQLVTNKRYKTAPIWQDSQTLNAVMNKEGKAHQFKLMVRQGVPDELRAIVWSKMLKLDELPDHERDYNATVKVYRLERLGDPKGPKVPMYGGLLDEDRFALTDMGVKVAKTILAFVAVEFPSVEYCPYLPTVIAVLLHQLGPDDTLAAARVIIRRSIGTLGSWFYCPTNLTDVMALYNAFSELANRHAGRLLKHLKAMEAQSQLEPFWIMWINNFMTDVLPLPLILRLMDSFVLEGYKVILRYGIAILMLRGPAIIKNAKTTNQFENFFASGQAFFGPDDDDSLSRTAFNISFSRAHVQRVVQRDRVKIGTGSDTQIDSQNFLILPPVLKDVSNILLPEHWEYLWSWLPKKCHGQTISRCFDVLMDGYNLTTFYSKCRTGEPQIVIIQTTEGAIFGAFLSDAWENNTLSNRYFGSAETFLYSLVPQDAVYNWVGFHLKPDDPPERIRELSESGSLFLYGTPKYLAIGGGGTKHGISLDEHLSRGMTGSCLTFNNPPLTGTGDESFQVQKLEVYRFH